jgi:hypothetical protein
VSPTRALRQSRACGLVATALLLVACASKSYTLQEEIAVPGENKAARARDYVTQERFEHLKAQIKQKFPHLSAHDLDGLFLRWKVSISTTSDQGTSIVVGIQYSREDFAAQPVVKECAEIVRRDLAAGTRQ